MAVKFRRNYNIGDFKEKRGWASHFFNYKLPKDSYLCYNSNIKTGGKLMDLNLVDIMYTEAQIEKTVKELGRKISDDYKGEDLIVVGILKGAFA